MKSLFLFILQLFPKLFLQDEFSKILS